MESGIETALWLQGRQAAKFARSEFKVAPSGRSPFSKLAEAWAKLRSRMAGWSNVVAMSQNGFKVNIIV
eukprot:12921805-Prorocentrum_lima.AAC.1